MRTVTSRDGTKIALDILGDGPPVIFVGGALADRSAGAPLAAVLARNFTVFNYDRRGRGDSGDTPPYAIEREVEDIAALIADAGGTAFLLGGSSGAVLALDATASGLAVNRLALYEPPFVVDGSAPPVPGDMVGILTSLVAAGRRSDAVEHYLTKALGVPSAAVAAMRDSPFWMQWEATAHTLAYDFTIMAGTVSGEPLPAGRWAAITVPTLVMDGGASPAQMHSGAQALADLLPTAERRTLPGQTHDVDVEVLTGVLTDFFCG
jgi:pimeloyl-ACP methyl ester carboxylesterase